MVALAYPDLLSTTVTGPDPVVVPAIKPMAAPAYIQPVSLPMLPNPAIAPPPPGQIRGEGGTTFAASSGGSNQPQLYVQPIVPDGLELEPGGGAYKPPSDDSGYNVNTSVPKPPVAPGRPGEDTVMPVPGGQQPTKPNIAPAVEAVTVPAAAGPIRGQFLGFELGVVPLWAWLVAAALIGARVLR